MQEEFKEYIRQSKQYHKSIKTIINWYDLYERYYIKLKKDFQINLFKKAVKKARNFSELGRKLNIGRKTIANCSRGLIKPQIFTLKKIIKYLDYDPNKINKKIISISRGYDHFKTKLPFRLNNKEGAEIRAAFLSDGHIDKSPTACAQYCAFEIESHKRLIKICKKVFGDFKARTIFGHKSYVTRFTPSIGYSIMLAGVPSGNKIIKNCFLPIDILIGNKEIKINYLKRVFDDEGDVYLEKNGKRAVRISRAGDITNYVDNSLNEKLPVGKWISSKIFSNIKNNLLIGELYILTDLGIKANLYYEGIYKAKNGNITNKWRIQISRREELQKFSSLINFNLEVKKQKLNKVLSSYQRNV